MRRPKRSKPASLLTAIIATFMLTTAYGVEYVDRAAKSDSIVDDQGETHFTLRPDDAPGDASARAQRAEKMPPKARAGRWYRYTWETWLPADTPRNIEQDVQVMQWRNRVGSPRTSIHLDRGRWQLRVNQLDGKPRLYSIDAALATWTQWDMFVYWSAKQDGHIRLVYGDVVLEHEGPNIWPADTGGSQAPHWSFGLYRPQWKHGNLRYEGEVALRRIKFRDYDYNELSDSQRSSLGLPARGTGAPLPARHPRY